MTFLILKKIFIGYQKNNGSEFIARKIQTWLKANHIKTLYIDPGSPWQNGFIESFHSRLRDECLNREWLLNLREARVVIEDWRQHLRTGDSITMKKDRIANWVISAQSVFYK